MAIQTHSNVRKILTVTVCSVQEDRKPASLTKQNDPKQNYSSPEILNTSHVYLSQQIIMYIAR